MGVMRCLWEVLRPTAVDSISTVLVVIAEVQSAQVGERGLFRH